MRALSDLSDRELLFELCQAEEALRQIRLPEPRPLPPPTADVPDEAAWEDVGALLAHERRVVRELRRRRHLGRPLSLDSVDSVAQPASRETSDQAVATRHS